MICKNCLATIGTCSECGRDWVEGDDSVIYVKYWKDFVPVLNTGTATIQANVWLSEFFGKAETVILEIENTSDVSALVGSYNVQSRQKTFGEHSLKEELLYKLDRIPKRGGLFIWVAGYKPINDTF